MRFIFFFLSLSLFCSTQQRKVCYLVHTHKHAHTCAHTNTHACTHTHKHARTHMHTHTWIDKILYTPLPLHLSRVAEEFFEENKVRMGTLTFGDKVWERYQVEIRTLVVIVV